MFGAKQSRVSTAPIPAFGDWPEVRLLLQKQDVDLGYHHTLQEILQQPETWLSTGNQMHAVAPKLTDLLQGVKAIVLTGSGSSEYAGESIRSALQKSMGTTTYAVGSGALLTDGTSLLPAERPALMVSFARSGDSPESIGALSMMLRLDPTIRQLVVTCNAEGRLAKTYGSDSRVVVVVLDEKTNDRSLVMTSSFTNMALAALSLGWQGRADEYVTLSQHLSSTGEAVLKESFARLPELARRPFRRAFYLASAPQFGAAKEAALKMTEMTAGSVMTASETYLGLRHGPMSAIDPQTLLVCFLSSDPTVRSYECDVIEELSTKQLGMNKLMVGSDVPESMLQSGDVAIEHDGFAEAGDINCGILHALVGQVAAFYRCMHEGLRPDAPSITGVIHRVVQNFTLRGMAATYTK